MSVILTEVNVLLSCNFLVHTRGEIPYYCETVELSDVLTFVRKLQQTIRLISTPIIVISATNNSGDRSFSTVKRVRHTYVELHGTVKSESLYPSKHM